MIKCNRCGNINAAGEVHCQSCGNAFSSVAASGSGPNIAAQEQSALPAWLESLRVGERPSRPATNSPTLSTADLIEEGSLPSWMHAQRNEAQGVTGASMPASLRSSSVPAPSTDGGSSSANGFAAQSLIDEQSLPSWMQGGEMPLLSPAESGIPPANLVEKDSMPDWMKSLQQQQPAVAGSGPPPIQAASTESLVKNAEPASPLPASSLASGFSARDLVDQQSLPPWMTQLGNQNSTTLANHEQAMPPGAALSQSPVNQPQQPIQPGQNGFSARDLVDQQSLPSWMTQQSDQDPTALANHEQAMSPGAALSQSPVNQPQQPIQPGPKGFSARDLVDQQSLPSWMTQQSDQNARSGRDSFKIEKGPQSNQPGTGLSGSSLLDMSALPSWLSESRPDQPSSPAYSQPPSSLVPSRQSWPTQEPADSHLTPDGRIAASSVIDMNALPEWLRSSGGQPVAPEIPSPYGQQVPYSAPYTGTPRVENVRVPSRPRGEVNSSETSEMAASVFASMLGVASSAPNYPAPTGVPYQQQSGQLGYMEQVSLSGASGVPNISGQVGMSSAHIGYPGGSGEVSQTPSGNSSAALQGYGPSMPSNPGAYSMPGNPNGSGVHNMPGNPGAYSMPGIPGGSGVHNMPGNPGAYSMPGIPNGSGVHNMPGNPAAYSMPGIPNGSGVHNMPGNPGAYSMPGNPGNPGAYSMPGNPGGSGVHNMPGNPAAYSMPGNPAAQSMSGIPGNPGAYSMPGMPGNPAAQSMSGIPGNPAAQSMSGNPGAYSMPGIPGNPGAYSMPGIPGNPAAQSMAGNVYGNYQNNGPMGNQAMQAPQYASTMRNATGGLTGPQAPGMAGEQKNMKKRGLFGALLDWLSR